MDFGGFSTGQGLDTDWMVMNRGFPRLLVFAREPVPGRVKSRLVPALGEEAVAVLYRKMLEGVLETVAGLAGAQGELWCDAAEREAPVCMELAARFGLGLWRQSGADLGERMFRALASGAGDGPAVLIGSDCPGYDAGYLSDAFDTLREVDVVLGPALDGGYVLIGLNHPAVRLFQGVSWGGPRVLEQTRERLRELGLCWHELPALRDLDRPEDLQYFGELLP